jgi:Uncharacterized protein conserved in bacteria (DUF2147)
MLIPRTKKMLLFPALILLCNALFAQSTFTGVWDTGKDNTYVKIFEKEGTVAGEVIHSDNPNINEGLQMIKDVKQEKNHWKGLIYSINNDEWVGAEMELIDNVLEVSISIFFIRKTLKWERIES